MWLSRTGASVDRGERVAAVDAAAVAGTLERSWEQVIGDLRECALGDRVAVRGVATVASAPPR
jgi:hypothetical protein